MEECCQQSKPCSDVVEFSTSLFADIIIIKETTLQLVPARQHLCEVSNLLVQQRCPSSLVGCIRTGLCPKTRSSYRLTRKEEGLLGSCARLNATFRNMLRAQKEAMNALAAFFDALSCVEWKKQTKASLQLGKSL